jgi:16S rRNA G966 N2-methylase RsmD
MENWKPVYESRNRLVAAIKAAADRIVTSYKLVFENTIVFQSYFTSVLIHIPRSLRVNIRQIVYESGYIHSSGPALYVRRIERASNKALLSRLQSFLKKEKKKIFITPYADEFFAPHESSSPVSIRNGLDGVRLQLRKHFIEDVPLLEYLATLPDRLKNRVFVPKGLKHYSDEREESIEKSGCSTKCTLWFVTDTNIEMNHNNLPRRGSDIYLFVYAQYFFNDNQFIIFKERKPAWYASITLPHTLSIAITNIVREYLQYRDESDQAPVFLDPFCGTGTSLIDATLRIPEAVAIGFDREEIVGQIVKDNFSFFSLPQDNLRQMVAEAGWLQGQLTGKAKTTDFLSFSQLRRDRGKFVASCAANEAAPISTQERFYRAFSLILREIESGLKRAKPTDLAPAIKKINDAGFSAELSNLLSSEKLSLQTRLYVYVIWRAIANGTFSLRDGEDFYGVIGVELGRFIKELTHLARSTGAEPLGKTGCFKEFVGSYSHAAIVDPASIIDIAKRTNIYAETSFFKKLESAPLAAGIHVVKVSNSVSALRKMTDQVDVIVTDPPYGFNTEEGGVSAMQQLFADIVPLMVKSLRKKGQLVLILPAIARNGREIPYFQTRGAVVRAVLSAVQAENRRCIQFTHTIPGSNQLFEFPIYWTSASVLERRILHFIVD